MLLMTAVVNCRFVWHIVGAFSCTRSVKIDLIHSETFLSPNLRSLW